MGLLSGMSGLGLKNLENANIFEEKKKVEEIKKAEPVKIDERELILAKEFNCPVCGNTFKNLVMKTGKAKLKGTDRDLRPKYEGIDAMKYDVILCPRCGYTALQRFFPSLAQAQAKLIKENISANVQLRAFNGETYSYEEAQERYKLALANAIVKRGKASERAFICLKGAWLDRGYRESLLEQGETDKEKLKAIEDEEKEFLENAYNGFYEARTAEAFPMCGMDELTIDYLIADLAIRFEKFDVASRMVSSILGNKAAPTRIKDKALELKEEIVAGLKNTR